MGESSPPPFFPPSLHHAVQLIPEIQYTDCSQMFSANLSSLEEPNPDTFWLTRHNSNSWKNFGFSKVDVWSLLWHFFPTRKIMNIVHKTRGRRRRRRRRRMEKGKNSTHFSGLLVSPPIREDNKLSFLVLIFPKTEPLFFLLNGSQRAGTFLAKCSFYCWQFPPPCCN